jgi:hypothetical protein
MDQNIKPESESETETKKRKRSTSFNETKRKKKRSESEGTETKKRKKSSLNKAKRKKKHSESEGTETTKRKKKHSESEGTETTKRKKSSLNKTKRKKRSSANKVSQDMMDISRSPVLSSITASSIESDMDKLDKLFNKIHLGDEIIVKAAIWGHGAETDHTQLFTPIPNLQLNIQGLAESGKCNIATEQVVSQIDHFLKTKSDWPLSNKALESKYKELLPTVIPTTTLNGKLLPQVNFGYVENYGNSSEKPRGDKKYSGEYNIYDGALLAVGVPIQGPLLRIYELIKDGINILPHPIDIQLLNGVSLTEIPIYIKEMVRSYPGINIRNIHKIIINLFDYSCNFTEDTPTVGAITKPKKQKKQSK